MFCPIDMTTKLYPIFCKLTDTFKTKNLKATTITQDWPLPVAKLVNSALSTGRKKNAKKRGKRRRNPGIAGINKDAIKSMAKLGGGAILGRFSCDPAPRRQRRRPHARDPASRLQSAAGAAVPFLDEATPGDGRRGQRESSSARPRPALSPGINSSRPLPYS